jgi:hypothetical protein
MLYQNLLHDVIPIYVILAGLNRNPSPLVGEADLLTVYGRAHPGRRKGQLRVASSAQRNRASACDENSV